MIVTLTANPSVDRTICVDQLVRGDVMRGSKSWAEPSGKGVNVTLALHAHGHASTAILPLGGVAGTELNRMLEATGAPIVTCPSPTAFAATSASWNPTAPSPRLTSQVLF